MKNVENATSENKNWDHSIQLSSYFNWTEYMEEMTPTQIAIRSFLRDIDSQIKNWTDKRALNFISKLLGFEPEETYPKHYKWKCKMNEHELYFVVELQIRKRKPFHFSVFMNSDLKPEQYEPFARNLVELFGQEYDAEEKYPINKSSQNAEKRYEDIEYLLINPGELDSDNSADVKYIVCRKDNSIEELDSIDEETSAKIIKDKNITQILQLKNGRIKGISILN